jgi:hypothetical protein
VVKLPRIQPGVALVDKEGKPSRAFVTFWNTTANVIEKQEARQDQQILDLQDAFAAIQAVSVVAQAAQTAANNAQSSADGGAPFTTSGSATGTVEAGTSGWQTGPQVDLTAAVVGDLTISGTGPQQDGSTIATQNITGDFRVVEIIGMAETTVFTGSGSIFAGSPATVLNNSSATVAAFSLARASTGAVSYRIDWQRTDGGALEAGVDLPLYIFARRAA